MARVFLSYDREDAGRARTIALALEKAGHTVWWDQIIRAGAQYGNEIEQAIEDSDAVVVLWSKRSVDSAWVRDEAAAGRDRGRLVPVLLDQSQPPMGFRQFQNIDLSRWNGRSGSAQLQNLLNAVAGSSVSSQALPPAVAPVPPKQRPKLWRLVAAAVAVVVLVAGFAFWRLSQGSPSVPLVTVIAADQSPGPKAWARDLLVKLASLQAADAEALRLVDQGSEARPDLIFEVGGTMPPDNPEANLLLRSGKDRSVLWSKDFQRPETKHADLRQQLAYTAAQVLRCALEGLNAEGKPLDQQVLKLYLGGCSSLAAEDNWGALVPTFVAVTRKAPSFEGAWARLLKIETRAAVWGDETQRGAVLPSLKRHLAEARNVNPHMVEVYIAEAELLPGKPLFDSMLLLDRAVAHNPENADALYERSYLLMEVGRINDGLADARRAAEIDPLSSVTQGNYIQFLAWSGRTATALEELTKAERLWPGASSLVNTRFAINANYGDPRDAIRTMPAEEPEVDSYPGERATRAYVKARIEPTKSNVERSLALARDLPKRAVYFPVLMQTLAMFGREDELFQALTQAPTSYARRIREQIFRPEFREHWRNPRAMQAAAKLGLIDYWRKSGKWPDFCSDAPYDCKAEAAKLVPAATRTRAR